MGKYQDKTGSDALADCLDCTIGKSNSAVGQEMCVGCVPGKYAKIGGMSECTKCIVGKSSNTKSRDIPCDECAIGFYAADEGSIECDDCATGLYVKSDAVSNVAGNYR